jgi:hypothetical protein
MPIPPNHSIRAAFDLLEGEIEETLADVNTDIGEAAKHNAYDKVSQLMKTGQELLDLKKALAEVEKRYARLIGTDDVQPTTSSKYIRKGLKTPQEAYSVPILQALVALGGRARIGDVLDRVYEIMKGQLNAYDHATYSDGKTVRWRNTAQWARDTLHKEGLLSDSPHGVWEIGDKGRAWLAKQSK